MIGIYKITNILNGHSYIGQSVNIEKRWIKEKSSAFNKNDIAYNYPLSKALRKYGVENFIFEVIEECSSEILNDREKFWINYYNTFYNGYNQTLGGDSTISQPKEYVIGIIKDLEETDLYHKEIAQKWNVSTETVQGINTGRYWFQENKDYPLQKKHKSHAQHRVNGIAQKKIFYCIKCGASITSKAVMCVECAQKESRKVERPDAKSLYDYLISINGNFSQAGRFFGVSDNAVRKWCKYYKIPSSSSEYKNIIKANKN